MGRLKKVSVGVSYTVAFICLAGVIYSPLFLGGRSLIWSVDGISQHLPILMAFQKMLKGIGSQALFGWSWNLGLGADQMTTFAYYVVGDPFNYLVALFPTNQIEFAYQFLILLRLYAAGLAFLTFAKLWHFSRLSLLIGTLTYTFTAFAVHIGMHHPFFLLPLVFFPLLCWGIERIFRGRPWWPLAVITALTVASNVYFAYLLAIGCCIYTGWRYWQRYLRVKTHAKLGQLLRRLISAVVLGVATASILAIPTVVAMLHSTRTGGQFANGLWTYPLGYYVALPNLILNGEGMPFWTIIGISGLTWLAVLHSLRHFKKRWDLNSLLVALLIGLLVPGVAAFFNVLTSPSNRWVLLSALLFSVLTMRLVDEWTELDVWDYRLFLGASVGLLVLIWVSNGYDLNVNARSLMTYSLLFILILWLMGWRTLQLSPRLMATGCFILLSLNLVNTGFSATKGKNGMGNSQQLYQQSATDWINSYLDGAQKVLPKDRDFYRTTMTPNFYARGAASGKKNISMLLGTHDIASYFSVQNRAVGQFSQAVGNQEADPNSPLSTVDGRTTIRNLLGVRYIFELANRYDPQNVPAGYHVLKTATGKVRVFKNQPIIGGLSNKTGTVVYVNRRALPLAYTQTGQIKSASFKRLNPVNREQVLIQGAETDQTMSAVKTIQPKKTAKSVPYTVRVRSTETQPVDPTNMTSRHILATNQQIVRQNQLENETGLHHLTSDQQGQQLTYDLVLKKPQRWQHHELYLEVSGLSMVKPTLKQTLQHDEAKACFADQPNTELASIQEGRQSLHADWNVSGYYLSAATAQWQNGFAQESPTNLSNYAVRQRVILNLGYSDHLRNVVTVRASQVPGLRIKTARVMAVGFNGAYHRRIKLLQKRGLKKQTVTNNTVTGMSSTNKTSVLTTSIPYSTGWHLTVDDQPTATQIVNKGFVGAKLPAGRHQIRLHYTTPGLKLGAMISIVGLLLLLSAAIWQSRHWTQMD